MGKEIIGISWWDASQMNDRIREEDFESFVGLSKNYNVGWVIHENDTRILLCFGTCSTGEFDIMAIPTGNVIERKTICKSS
jgi:hypothetical protein